jgi:serine/threonine protein kinase
MGRVYRARQLRPQRTVAVKLVRPGLTAELAQRRLENEATFLAKLQHPAIAQVYLVGTYGSDFGPVPYYVMEYVDGATSLTTHACEKNLGPEERLELFREVCEAVAHGHERGVIHRDLKPGNILVDGEGRPKVIDFGIARSIDGELAAHAGSTRTGQLLGTLQYMSPEQFSPPPEGLDARSDVYSLGVVLFELISGQLPYDVQNRPPHEVSRLVCERAPRLLASSGAEQELGSQMTRIVSRCLEKSPSRRYRDAGELAVEIRRCLAGEFDRQRPGRLSRRRVWAALVAVAASLVVGATLLKPPTGESSGSPGTSAGPGGLASLAAGRPGDEAGARLRSEPVRATGVPRPSVSADPDALVDPVVGRWVCDDPDDRWVKEFQADGDFFNREPDGATHRGRWTRIDDATVEVKLNGGWRMACVTRGEHLGVTQTTSQGVTGPEKVFRREQ